MAINTNTEDSQNTDANINVDMMIKAIEILEGRIKTEASGNVNMQSVKKIASTGVDYISSGMLTHSVKALDLSLKINMN